MQSFAFFVTTGFYLGLVPAAILRQLLPSLPERRGLGGGLMGSLIGLALQVLILSGPFAMQEQVALVALTFVLGLWLVGPAEIKMFEMWGYMRRHDGSKARTDYNATCIDEIHGQLLAGLSVYVVRAAQPVECLLFAFTMFRLFDAGKLWPVGYVERQFKDSAFGVMFDDTVAGLMAAVVTIWAYNLK